MRIIEFEAKRLLRQMGLPVPSGELVASPEQAARAAQLLGGLVVLKAQLPMGGRMKAGGIHFAISPALAAEKAETLLGRKIHCFTEKQILVEQQIQVEAQVFIGALYGTETRSATLVASAAGGINVESAGMVIHRPFSFTLS